MHTSSCTQVRAAVGRAEGPVRLDAAPPRGPGRRPGRGGRPCSRSYTCLQLHAHTHVLCVFAWMTTARLQLQTCTLHGCTHSCLTPRQVLARLVEFGGATALHRCGGMRRSARRAARAGDETIPTRRAHAAFSAASEFKWPVYHSGSGYLLFFFRDCGAGSFHCPSVCVFTAHSQPFLVVSLASACAGVLRFPRPSLCFYFLKHWLVHGSRDSMKKTALDLLQDPPVSRRQQSD